MSQRPQSILRTTSAAIGHLYKAKGLENIAQDESPQRLITALVKSGTECPLTRSKVMPVFSQTFQYFTVESSHSFSSHFNA